MITVSSGRLVDAPSPRSASDVRRLMALPPGISTVVRGGERHDAALGELARSFSEALPGEVHVQLYATPAGTNSYGWHYDFEDVFIAQTAGVKDYYFRDNTEGERHTAESALDTLFGRDERLTPWQMGSRAWVMFFVALAPVLLSGRRRFSLR